MSIKKNPLQVLLEEIPAFLRNKYILALILFFGWMLFFDKHDVITQWRLQRTVNRLEEDKAFYREKIEEAKKERLEIEINKEKLARERYFMKKDGEDVFIIVDEED